MNSSSESDSFHDESNTVSVEECRKPSELATGTANVTQETDEAQQQMDGGRTADSVRSSLSNFRQSASRTTGQIRELLETSKSLDRDLVSFLQDPQTRAVLEGVDDLDDDEDKNLLELAEEGSTDNPKEVEALKQKTKSLKRKLRKWRKAARMALSEVSPDMSAEAQGDMTPGTMKNVLQKIRQLKSLTERQTSIIMTLTNQCDAQKTESAEKDSLIMELLKNCNGIRPSLSSESQQQENLTTGGGGGASNIEGMVTKHENIAYQLISAAEVEEVLNQPGIQFGSAYLIPDQIQKETRAEIGGGGGVHQEVNNHGSPTPSHNRRPPSSEIQYPINPTVIRNITGAGVSSASASSMKSRTVWLGVAVGVAAGVGKVLMGHSKLRGNNKN
eukprot:g3230.t1